MESGVSPSTLKNKLAAIRKYVRLSGGCVKGVNSERVSLALDAFQRSKVHVSNKKDPISIRDFKAVLDIQPDNYIGNSVKSMLLILFFGAFRQSEIAPVTCHSFDPSVSMCRRDIKIKQDKLYISLRWAKNQQKYTEIRKLCIPSIEDKKYCPVSNLMKVLKSSPSDKRSDPLFMFKDKRPITVGFLKNAWKKSLSSLNINNKLFTLHSVRKAAASSAFDMGCSELHIRRYAWNSDAHLSYIKTSSQNVVTKALARAIQKK